MRQINIVLDVYSIVICAILLFYLLSVNRQKEKLNIYFALICCANIGMTLGDLTNWLCEGTARTWYPFLLKTGMFVYYMCASFVLLSFTKYVMEYLSPKVIVSRYVWQITLILNSIYLTGCVFTLFANVYYYFTPDNYYVRGRFFLISQAIPFTLYLLNFFIVIKNRKHLQRRESIFFLSYILLPGIAEIIQIQVFGVALMNTAITLSLLLILVNVQMQNAILMRQAEAELVKSRIDTMLSQIQPHFLYNSLTAIRELCDIDIEEAKAAIVEFSKYLRANMNGLTAAHTIPFTDELQHTRNYLSLEKRRFGKRLNVTYEIQETDFFVPPLTLQPIVENSVRHGITKRPEGGTIRIQTGSDASFYHIKVMDDGIGFAGVDALDKDPHIGIANVQSRLASMCGGFLTVTSSSGMGTTATLYIPREVHHENNSR